MKRLGLLLWSLAIAGCAGQESTLIEGKFIGAAPQEVSFVFPSAKGAVDTLVTVVDGAFSISLPIDKTVSGLFSFTLDEGKKSKAFISDGSNLNYVIHGDEISMTSSDPVSLNYELEAFFDKQADVFRKVQQNPDSYDELIDFCQNMFQKNLDNWLGLLAFQFVTQKEDDDTVEERIGRFSPEMQANALIQERLQRIQTKRAIQEGAMFRNLEVTMPDGSVRRLSDYIGHGKYVLVDFWASWCRPCNAETPFLKAVYEKYAGPKFDIVGVTVNDEVEKAMEYVAGERIPWDQLYMENDKASKTYGFSSIPQAFLFGPDGILLKRDGLRGEAIDQILSEYL